MSSQAESKYDSITYKDMYVIEKAGDGTLRTAFYPIDYNSRVLDELRELSGKVKAWEDDVASRLITDANRFTIDLYGEQKPDVSTIAKNFRDRVWEVYDYSRVGGSGTLYGSSGGHEKWYYPGGVNCLPEYSTLIKGFDVTREAIGACKARLKDPDYQRLVWAYNEAVGMRFLLLSSLELYEKGFYRYVERARQICPGIFDYKEYCRSFSGTLGQADLDYDMTPGNQCAVENIGEYFWACVMEGLYATYDNANSIVAYSHRKRGFYKYKMMLERECDLFLLQETNFGFGSVRYFRTTLSYKGINAINASYIIFFEHAGRIQYASHTFFYDVEEASFKPCFDAAVRIHGEYRAIGEAAFVDKYFRKSLIDLSKLLLFVAHTNVFLHIKTLKRFDELTSCDRNELEPDGEIANVGSELSSNEEKAVKELAEAIESIVKSQDVDSAAGNIVIKELVGKLLVPSGSELRNIAKRDLVRGGLFSTLAPKLGQEFDVRKLVDAIVPPDEGAYMKAYEGYDLISIRVEKASSVINIISRLREIAALTQFESVIGSIASTCAQIGSQAQKFISEEINPELGRTVPVRDRLKEQLDRLEVKMEEMRRRRSDTRWIGGQVQNLRAQIAELNSSIFELNKQKGALESYIKSARSIQG